MPERSWAGEPCATSAGPKLRDGDPRSCARTISRRRRLSTPMSARSRSFKAHISRSTAARLHAAPIALIALWMKRDKRAAGDRNEVAAALHAETQQALRHVGMAPKQLSVF